MLLRGLPVVLAALVMSHQAMAEPPTFSGLTPAGAAPPAAAAVIGSAASSPILAPPKLNDEAARSTTDSQPAETSADGALPGKAGKETGEASASVEKPKPQPPTLVAKINLSKQQMDVIVGGVSKHTWAVSSGRQGFETPRGSFRAQWTAKLWHSRTYDLAPMPHAVFFHNGAAVHATSSVGMLGQPASHGCVRLSPANAATFYAMVQKHGTRATQIQVFGKEPAPRVARRPAPSLAGRAGQQITYLPPGSPYAGRQSFVHNGVVYVRVR